LRQLLARYTFTFAMENAVLDDYVTEKVYHPLMAGRCVRLHSTLEYPRAPLEYPTPVDGRCGCADGRTASDRRPGTVPFRKLPTSAETPDAKLPTSD
jgi:hypothetical protein